MKIQILASAFAAVIVTGCAGGDNYATRTPEPSPSYGAYDEPYPVLNAYGNWMDVGAYGRVWQPAVMSDWRPYTNGQWVWTDRGWMWDSDEPFGWVVYHYGYWTQIGALGWVWVPGNEWSPARVNWYTGNDYIGWCPMAPPHASYPEAYQTGYENYWTVVPAPQFTRLNVGAYRTIPPASPSRTPPPAGRGRATERPPDIITIQGATHQLIAPRKTEEDQVRIGRRTVARVRVAQDNIPTPRPVYAVPANPDVPQPPPSAPPVLPGGARIVPRQGAPVVTPPPPVQQRTPSPVRITPAPAPVTTVPAPAPSRSTPVPQPVRVAPTPAPVRVAPVPVAPGERNVVVPPKPPVKREVQKEEKKEVKPEPKPKTVR